ncbi:cystathionine beta-lyase, chloroplastic isoform X2 [Vitis vinifera]|uniref:cystathionine beta-lyase, chloroplastic isoform X2 n=1 Tax=Vitis vinifera TaxID=29760 RepID=UPI0005401133|nr:cystathionine beta-lyase, chloroplastic isoform X2 [Vitis vinifera]|eukprot:XP_010653953.1 PREDICTED: cystathionine beta-lyase, chloroplastic isoform X2 [Vitis vinifera]
MGFVYGKVPASLRFNTVKGNRALFGKKFELNCFQEKEMDVSTSAVVDGIADRLTEMEVKEPSISTMLINYENKSDPFDAVSPPLYQTATFKQPSATENGPYDYTRSGNPTRDVLESLLARLDKADRAFCFTSGMAALAAVTHLIAPGEEIVAGEDIYGGSDRLLSQVTTKRGIVVKRVDTTNLEEVASAIGPMTKLVWLESPTNPRLQISDIRKITEMAHTHGALLLVDNSIMSPVLSQPLELGADIVMHSATKFIAGHSDVMAGVLAVKGESLAKDLYFLQNAEGSGLAPFDCWICLRGIKTMALRVEKQQENAQKIAEFLSSHPRVKKVNYAGLPDHPGRSLHYSQAKGAGSVLSFLTGSLEFSKYIVETTKYFSITVSFGSVKSLISMPCFMSHASIPAAVREARGLTEDLVRISVGIEDINDLIADLDYALRTGPQ